MMLSLRKHTKSPVKFWFLKNYLSPQFIDFLPHMAKEYDFQYELVQYKWPRWLHQQTEKQRTIWGYKILFFDVLFPLDVKKIIFVDADAVSFYSLKIQSFSNCYQIFNVHNITTKFRHSSIENLKKKFSDDYVMFSRLFALILLNCITSTWVVPHTLTRRSVIHVKKWKDSDSGNKAIGGIICKVDDTIFRRCTLLI